MKVRIRRWVFGSAACLALGAGACATKAELKEEQNLREEAEEAKEILVIEMNDKAQKLQVATNQLVDARENLDDQRRRLQVICGEYPEHDVCAPQTALEYAKKAFCEDANFTEHVDEVVAACHQGACKQVDDAQLLQRQQYMTLVQRLPHKLVLFEISSTELDPKDRRAIQQFIETVQAEKGYVIIVGRASKDGSWKVNLRLALDRAEHTRKFIIELGLDPKQVGYITYGHEKMYLTTLDAERLGSQKMSERQANRSALLFAYPCFKGKN
jgi:outer membrane protein OmpA-like peptidoglycan-associated protein